MDIADYSLSEDELLRVPFMGADAESIALSLVYTATASNSNLFPPQNIYLTKQYQYSATQILNLTPVSNIAGSSYIDITVTDEHGGSGSHQFTVTVDPVPDPPILSRINTYTITENDSPFYIPIELKDHDQFFSPDSKSITIVNDSIMIKALSSVQNNLVNLSLMGMDCNNTQECTINTIAGETSSLTLSVTPVMNAFGHTTISVTAIDSYGLTDIKRFDIIVRPLPVENTPPIAFDKDIGIDEDKYLYIKLKATDQENDDLTYYILTPPNHGSITKTNDTVLYTPNPHYNGPDSFTYKANDSHDDSNTASIMITIYPIYDPPVAHALNITTCENIPKNLILTAFSPDNLPLTFQIKDQPTHGILSQGTPYITYTPD
ncbi:MAG: hypothetical protein OMM_13507, partial [Candidatus Magnetoglobus multicellularis str. Araruama]